MQKTCLVTGASSGIGKSLSSEMVRKGWKVIGVARSQAKLKNLQKQLGQDKFLPMTCDVSNIKEVKQVSNKLKKNNELPTILFLNAGLAGEAAVDKPNQLDLTIYETTIKVNYLGVLAWIAEWEELLQKNNGGTFVVTSSVNAFFCPPGGNAYSSSKAAIARAFKGLQTAYHKSNLSFSIVYPGPVKTKGLKGQLPFTQNPQKVAQYIIKQTFKGKQNIYPSSIYYIITKILNCLPNSLILKIFK